MRIRILPYRAGSRSVATLITGLREINPRTKQLRLIGSTFQPRLGDLLINWGNSNGYPGALNGDSGILRRASNKLLFFRHMEGTNLVPQHWENPSEIPEEVFPIVCRTVLAGHSGQGIHISGDTASLVPASLYVRYIKKQSEFRIHCGRTSDGQSIILDRQRKVRRPGTDVSNWQVRNLDNGFIYQRNGIEVPEQVESVALETFNRSGLDFGAVDVIYNAHEGRAYSLEINTAPGLEGQTVSNYVNFFLNRSN